MRSSITGKEPARNCSGAATHTEVLVLFRPSTHARVHGRRKLQNCNSLSAEGRQRRCRRLAHASSAADAAEPAQRREAGGCASDDVHSDDARRCAAQRAAQLEHAHRRKLLLCACAASLPGLHAPASAAPFDFPIPWREWFPASPEPVLVPRRNLNLNFAVLLMRSTYEAVDALDFVAMDKFQIAFWKLRQAQFERYKAQLAPAPVPVGNLASPLYFDYIAFAQYATISNIIPEAPQVFEEYCESCEGDPFERPNRVVRRDASIADNKQLPKRLQLEVGRSVYSKLREGFRGEYFACPAPLTATASAGELRAALDALLKVFADNGFALKANTRHFQQQSSEFTWEVRIEGSATLWGLQALRAQRALITDAFDAFSVAAFLDASGFDYDYELDVNKSYADQFWRARPRRLVA